MIEIRRIEPNEWLAAKQLIYRVAREVFNDPRPLEELIDSYEAKGELEDMDDIQHNYFEKGGIFLVLTQDRRIIGTGAIRQLEDKICELKRLWLLTEYHNLTLGTPALSNAEGWNLEFFSLWLGKDCLGWRHTIFDRSLFA